MDRSQNKRIETWKYWLKNRSKFYHILSTTNLIDNSSFDEYKLILKFPALDNVRWRPTTKASHPSNHFISGCEHIDYSARSSVPIKVYLLIWSLPECLPDCLTDWLADSVAVQMISIINLEILRLHVNCVRFDYFYIQHNNKVTVLQTFYISASVWTEQHTSQALVFAVD